MYRTNTIAWIVKSFVRGEDSKNQKEAKVRNSEVQKQLENRKINAGKGENMVKLINIGDTV